VAQHVCHVPYRALPSGAYDPAETVLRAMMTVTTPHVAAPDNHTPTRKLRMYLRATHPKEKRKSLHKFRGLWRLSAPAC